MPSRDAYLDGLLGEQSLKNIAVPVRAYAIIWGGPSPKPAERPRLGRFRRLAFPS